MARVKRVGRVPVAGSAGVSVEVDYTGASGQEVVGWA